MNRLKNYALWAAILAFVPMLLNGLEVYNIDIILPGNYDKLVNMLLGILVLAGILNNPTKGRGYKDNE